jgi:hypothetical protein
MEFEAFKNKALAEFTREITDQFFLYIESDKELMQDYLRTIGRENDLDTTNKKLGKAVKDWFKLDNGKENPEPESYLIRSYTEHIKRTEN